MIKPPIEQQIIESLKAQLTELGIDVHDVQLEIPRQKEMGDLSTNIAMSAASIAKRPPREIADLLAKSFPTSSTGIESVEVAGPGFLNFRFAPGFLYVMLARIIADPEEFGNGNEGESQRWNFEFVSANPTGPLNVVSARAASVGDALVRIFRKRGFQAQSEYYFNDAGRQVLLLGESVNARLRQHDLGAETAQIPEGGYHGEYILDLARAWRGEHPSAAPIPNEEMGAWATNWMLESQRGQLSRFRVSFDHWFREASLHSSGRVDSVISRMKELGHAYEKDGALWFRGSEFGDTDDRVLVTSEGRATYRVPDMAYHIDKFERGFIKAVVLLGPDHHGAIITLTAALKALGLPNGFYNGTIVQQVNLLRDGEPVKMSKRAGMMVTLDELVDEVGVDAARFFFLRRKVSTPLDFDIELAKKHSDENPVYYVQYAHARICSILRQPGAIDAGAEGEPAVATFQLLTSPEELDLLKTLALFSWSFSAVVRSMEPQILTTYLTDVARSFHFFYTKHRVITTDLELTRARLGLCRGVAGVLKEGLKTIGVEAPVKM